VLASIERPEQIAEATSQGYAPALVVPEFPNGKRAFMVEGTRFIPCPAETTGTNCVNCRLCLDVDLFRMNAGIAFKAHGPDVAQARAALVQIGRRAA
jgi:hypothetical protein